MKIKIDFKKDSCSSPGAALGGARLNCSL